MTDPTYRRSRNCFAGILPRAACAMESPEDLPPLTFAVPATRESKKKQAPPCIVPLTIPPIHFSAVGFIATALAKQIMHARGRINQAFTELESRVKVRRLCHSPSILFCNLFSCCRLKYNMWSTAAVKNPAIQQASFLPRSRKVCNCVIYWSTA